MWFPALRCTLLGSSQLTVASGTAENTFRALRCSAVARTLWRVGSCATLAHPRQSLISRLPAYRSLHAHHKVDRGWLNRVLTLTLMEDLPPARWSLDSCWAGVCALPETVLWELSAHSEVCSTGVVAFTLRDSIAAVQDEYYMTLLTRVAPEKVNYQGRSVCHQTLSWREPRLQSFDHVLPEEADISLQELIGRYPQNIVFLNTVLAEYCRLLRSILLTPSRLLHGVT